MDSSTITLHSQARDLLFKHYQVIARIFRDVIGQFEVDYISIALLTPKAELLFFSSRPSVDWNIIDRNSWVSDFRFQYDFFHSEQSHCLNMDDCHIGLAIPASFDNYKVVYTFASKTKNKSMQLKLLNSSDSLIKIGKFCLKSILYELSLSRLCLNKTELKLVINNKELV